MQCWRHGFDPWIGRIPWRRKWLPTPVFLSGEFHGQESGGLQSMGSQRVDTAEWLTLSLLFILVFQEKVILGHDNSLISGWNINIFENVCGILGSCSCDLPTWWCVCVCVCVCTHVCIHKFYLGQVFGVIMSWFITLYHYVRLFRLYFPSIRILLKVSLYPGIQFSWMVNVLVCFKMTCILSLILT